MSLNGLPRILLLLSCWLWLAAGAIPNAMSQGVSVLEQATQPSRELPSTGTAEELPLPAPAEQTPTPAEDSPTDPFQGEPKPAETGRSAGATRSSTQLQLVGNFAMHEAFAVNGQPIVSAGPIVTVAPPMPVREQPPEQPTGGTNRAWIPGYWAWHDDTQAYIWTSGMWREIPPGRKWTPGTWFTVTGGFRWSRGYWADSNLAGPAQPLLRSPPTSGQYGPDRETTSSSSFWLPGEYVWDGSQYKFKNGYWTKQQPDFVWQPSCYVQTADGFVFVSGYWDFELSIRGMPCAPVLFPETDPNAPAWDFSPTYLVSTPAALPLHMFLRPNDSHYFFGDYYSQPDTAAGYLPWYSPESVAYSTSAMLSHYQWKYQQLGIDFVASMQRLEQLARGQVRYRPIVQPVQVGSWAVAVSDPVSAQAGSLEQLLLDQGPGASGLATPSPAVGSGIAAAPARADGGTPSYLQQPGGSSPRTSALPRSLNNTQPTIRLSPRVAIIPNVVVRPAVVPTPMGPGRFPPVPPAVGPRWGALSPLGLPFPAPGSVPGDVPRFGIAPFPAGPPPIPPIGFRGRFGRR